MKAYYICSDNFDYILLDTGEELATMALEHFAMYLSEHGNLENAVQYFAENYDGIDSDIWCKMDRERLFNGTLQPYEHHRALFYYDTETKTFNYFDLERWAEHQAEIIKAHHA